MRCQTPSFTDCTKLQPLYTSFSDGFGFFWMQSTKQKTNLQIYSTESKASFTDRGFLALAMAFNLLPCNLTGIAKAKKPLCQ